MNDYFRSIGFDKLSGEQINLLAREIKERPDRRVSWGGEGFDVYWEHFKYYGDNIGVLVRGKTDEFEIETVEACMPVYMPELEISCNSISVESTGGNYLVSYENGDNKNRMTFSLQNSVDYLKNKDLKADNVSVVGLSLGGTILLPVVKKNHADKTPEDEKVFYRELLEKARTGNDLAQQLLNVKVQKTADSIRRRLYKEDLLSIIEGFLMPSTEDCMYFMMGNIVSIKTLTNAGTAERVYRFTLMVAGVEMDIVVNSGALAGMPMVGMRFLGGCWLQGRLNYK